MTQSDLAFLDRFLWQRFTGRESRGDQLEAAVIVRETGDNDRVAAERWTDGMHSRDDKGRMARMWALDRTVAPLPQDFLRHP